MPLKNFKRTEKQLLFLSRDSQKDPRIGDILIQELTQKNIIIAGYPDDEGIANNHGRVGAKGAPDRIRHFLYRMTPPVSGEELGPIFDIGNLEIQKIALKERHEHAKKAALQSLKSGHRWMALGGGHDYAYADGAALIEFAVEQKQKPLIINFDAHLDVRPIESNINSGTAFQRLLSEYTNFDLLEIGIQDHCNSKTHMEWLKSKGGKVLLNEEILCSNDSPVVTILKFIEPWIAKRRLTFVSMDIDVFTTSQAPGCSQSWPLGLQSHDVFKVLEVIRTRMDVRALGIYEVSPVLDVADMTAKLAAQIAYQFLKA